MLTAVFDNGNEPVREESFITSWGGGGGGGGVIFRGVEICFGDVLGGGWGG